MYFIIAWELIPAQLKVSTNLTTRLLVQEGRNEQGETSNSVDFKQLVIKKNCSSHNSIGHIA